MKPVLILAALAAAFAGAAPAAQFKYGEHILTVPDGFEVNLVAAAPLVTRPISVAFDDRGFLYVTDSSGSSDKGPTQYERKDHRVLRLEDSDGDGKSDKQTVFADKMMFPEGALFHDGSLYVAAPPQIWKLTDTDGDGVADKREVWFDGKTLTGCANDLHGPFLGRDGWIYWAKGAFAEQHHTLPNGRPFKTRASHFFRARADGTGLEPVMTGGMDNPVDITFTAAGERIFSTTFFQQPGGGKRDGLIHAIYGGVYGKAQDAIEGHKRTGDLMPVLHHSGASAPCGLTTYDSRVFGDDWRDNLLACYFNLRKVVRHQLVPDGATFKTKDSDFITSDQVDFHPTDVQEDADGSVLVVDTGGWYKICCPTSQLAKPDVLGGIYRVRRTGAAPHDDPRGLKLAWDTMKPADLAKLLADERLFVRERAVRELAKKGKDAVPLLREVLVKAPPAARLNSVWTLSRIEGRPAREAVRFALNDADATVRHAAIHVAALWRDPAAVGRLQSFLEESDDARARAAAEALGRIGDKSAVPALLAAANRVRGSKPELTDAARVLEHSLIFAMIEIGDREAVWGAATRIGGAPFLPLPCGESEKPQPVRFSRAALLALDQMDGAGLKPETVVPLLTSRDPVLKQTASWIVGRHAEWGGAVANLLRQRLAAGALHEPERADLQSQLASLAKSPDIQELLAASLRNEILPAESRALALRAMAASGLKETPPRWHTELALSLAEPDAELVRQAVATVRAMPQPKQPHAALADALAQVGRAESAAAAVRLDALSAAPALATVEEPLFDFLCANLDGAKPMLVRSAAASVLAKAKLAPDQQLALAGQMKVIGPLEAPKLLPVFERGPNVALGLRLVAALRDSAGLPGLRADLLKPLFAKYPKSVQDAAASLLDAFNVDAAKQAAHLDTLLAQLKGGDANRGHAVFLSSKAACSTCHATGYLGGRLGPDLTNLGKVRTERDLLESIVYPNASFVRSYESFIVATKDGENHSGILKKDAPDELVLATGPETEQRIPRGDVASVRPGAVSLMPAGMDTILTKQELADLLAFLKAAK